MIAVLKFEFDDNSESLVRNVFNKEQHKESKK